MNIKDYLIFAGIVLLFVACSNDSDIVNKSNEQVPVRVHVDGFGISQSEFPGTRATAVADYNDLNAVMLAFYQGTTEVEKIIQLKADASTYTTFGDFECSLAMGTYTMVVVAYTTKTDNPFVLTSPTAAAYTGLHAYDTFVTTQAVTIGSTNAADISATLNRVATKLQVVSTDGKAADVTNVRMTVSAGSRSFNPTTGFATDNAGFANTVGVSASAGATSMSNTFMFLVTDEQTMDVTIETLDADGNTLFSTTVEDVPFKRNRVTKLTGAMYTNTGIGGVFQVNTDWLEDEEVAF